MSTSIRAFLLGLACGGRSMTGPAALALTWRTPLRTSDSRKRWVPRAAVAAAAGEIVADKLPQMPSRLDPAPYAARVAVGALCGGLLTHREGGSSARTVVGAVLGGSGAAAGSQAGAAWRKLAAARVGPDTPGAVVEDVASIGLAAVATRTALR